MKHDTVTLDDDPPMGVRTSTPLDPTHIDRFRVIGRLGEGGMGVVYEAHDPKLDRRVAIKLVRATCAQPDAQANLVREAQAMARLHHPNVVAVYEVGIFEGRAFVAMELVKGVTLRAWIAAQRRPWRRIVTLFLGASCGLAAAHEAGLVHRDFKPDNVLIAEDETPRLADFGLARPRDVAGDAPAGTLTYMAPEQHDCATLTEAADQFAFAAALWEAVFRMPPFAGERREDLATAKRAGRLTPPPDRTPRWLVAILQRALSPRPKARFASLDALASALKHGLARRRQGSPDRRSR